jgi:hypothetical protein
VHVGLIACPDQLDDLAVLAECFHGELDALVAACNLTPHPRN